MEYLSNNRGRNCLKKWFAHTLYFWQMHQEYDLGCYILLYSPLSIKVKVIEYI